MTRTLHIIRSAYRANLEEQDDPILWLVQAMQKAGAVGAVLLRGTAVGYGVAAQDASGLAFGRQEQTQPPRIADDVTRMIDAGIPVHFVSEDTAERGIAAEELVPGLTAVDREKVADLLGRYEQVLAW